jgi:hypothetical protein
LLDGHVLQCDGRRGDLQRLFVLINHGPHAASAQVRLSLDAKIARVTDLFAQRTVETFSDLNGLCFEMVLDGYDSTTLLVEPVPE